MTFAQRFAIISVSLSLFSLTFAVVNALGHGPHHSPIRPAYDCYRDANFTDTEGDVVVTVDLDLGVNVVWKCTCEWVGPRLNCYWREVRRFAIRQKALNLARAMTDGPAYPGPLVRKRIPVKWLAWHGDACYIHRGFRYVLMDGRVG